jgi:hypothetical protein
MKTIIIYFFISLTSLFCFSQSQPIDVTERTFKISGISTEELYFGFQEGDQIIVTFLELENKPLKEVEITELPSSSKYMEYETTGFENKALNISRKSIYKFRFYNSAVGGRICKIKIQRIPANEALKNFNTNVIWKVKYDTSYFTVQERYLAKRDTVLVTVCDQIATVHSSSVLSGTPSKTITDFILPANTVSWSYYIGVNNAGEKVYQEANQKILSSASEHASKIPGYGPMIALAIDGVSYFSPPPIDDNVLYYFLPDYSNAQSFMAGGQFLQYKQGDVVVDHGRMTSPLQPAKYHIALYNDNIQEGINVNIKIIAVTVTQIYAMRDVKKYNVATSNIAYNEE